jgi:hypothetical protein
MLFSLSCEAANILIIKKAAIAAFLIIRMLAASQLKLNNISDLIPAGDSIFAL